MMITNKEDLAEMLRIVEEARVLVNRLQGVRGFTLRVSPQSVLNLIEETKVRSVGARLLVPGDSGQVDHSVLIIHKIEGGKIIGEQGIEIEQDGQRIVDRVKKEREI